MKTKVTTAYLCEVCEAEYRSPGSARSCESVPVREDRGVKVGDKVRITQGDGAWQLATVIRLTVIPPGYGPRQYDHTRALDAELDGDWGNRFLLFDCYEVKR